MKTMSEGRLSDDAKRQVQRMLREVDDLESIGDCCFSLARTLCRKQENCPEPFNSEQFDQILRMENLVSEALTLMTDPCSNPKARVTTSAAAMPLKTR